MFDAIDRRAGDCVCEWDEMCAECEVSVVVAAAVCWVRFRCSLNYYILWLLQEKMLLTKRDELQDYAKKAVKQMEKLA